MRAMSIVIFLIVVMMVISMGVFAKKPRPPQVEPLALDDSILQVAGCGSESGLVNVWSHDGETYNNIWQNTCGERVPGVVLGDTDNDGYKELAVFISYTTGKRKKDRVTHREIHIYEQGDQENPSRVSADLQDIGCWDLALGDANNDGMLELVVAGGSFIAVFEDTGTEINEIWRSENVEDDMPFGVTIGDADSDGYNELVYAAMPLGQFVVYEHLGGNEWGDEVYSEAITGALDDIKIGDTDDDGINEVVGGGNHNKLTIFEKVGDSYVIDFESEDLGGFTPGFDTGDFDNDGDTEIAIGTQAYPGPYYLYIFEYDYYEGTYVVTYQDGTESVSTIFAGDADNDGVDEITIGTTDGFLIYDYLDDYTLDYLDPTVWPNSLWVG
jgi:hypothetical protein